jgi:hypothetical protein
VTENTNWFIKNIVAQYQVEQLEEENVWKPFSHQKYFNVGLRGKWRKWTPSSELEDKIEIKGKTEELLVKQHPQKKYAITHQLH